MKVRIKKEFEHAVLPTRRSEYAAGYDLYACIGNGNPKEDYVVIQPGETKKIDTGVSMELPNEYAGFIFARSGLATDHGIKPANCVGLIDPDYRGHYIVAVHND